MNFKKDIKINYVKIILQSGCRANNNVLYINKFISLFAYLLEQSCELMSTSVQESSKLFQFNQIVSEKEEKETIKANEIRMCLSFKIMQKKFFFQV